MNNTLSERIQFENGIYDAITSRYEDGKMPETVITAVAPDRQVILLGEYHESSDDPRTADWNLEEIDTDNLSDNISEVASFYFDPRYFNC